MLDPIFALALQAALSPPPMPSLPPSFSAEQRWRSGLAARAAEEGGALIEKRKAQITSWEADLDRFSERFREKASVAWTQPEMEALTDTIEKTEAGAEHRAQAASRMEAKFGLAVRRAAKHDAALASTLSDVGRQLRALDRSLLKALLDFAMRLRALRAEVNPESRGGPVFDTPEALNDYLQGLLPA